MNLLDFYQMMHLYYNIAYHHIIYAESVNTLRINHIAFIQTITDLFFHQ